MSPERITHEDFENQDLISHHTARYKFAKEYVRGKAIVDIACGTGYGSALLLEGAPRKIIGIDISAEAINYAKKNYKNPEVIFLQGSIEVLGMLEPIDVIISFETIEHVLEYNFFLRKVAEKTGSIGKFIISTPIRQGGVFTDKPANPYHVQEWDEVEFLDLLSRYFESMEVFYQYTYRKLWYPGSRTLSKVLATILYPEWKKKFQKFEVCKSTSFMPGISVIRGYIVVVCSGAKIFDPM